MFHRNAKVRSRAEHEHQLLRNRMCKIDNSQHPNIPNTTPVLHAAPNSTSVAVFHPYDSVLITAGKNIVSVWNPQMGSGGKINQIELNYDKKNRYVNTLESVSVSVSISVLGWLNLGRFLNFKKPIHPRFYLWEGSKLSKFELIWSKIHARISQKRFM